MPLLISSATALLALAAVSNTVAAQKTPVIPANCVSGRYTFDPARGLALDPGAGGHPANIDTFKYDFTIDYGAGTNVRFLPEGGIALVLTKDPNGGPATGARISLAQRVVYARITTSFSCVGVPGVVSTFITMSPIGDEIDLEAVGSDTNSIQTNVFYKGVPEFGIHSTTEPIADTTQQHTYTIDWKHDVLTWSIDGKIVRTLNKEESISSGIPPNERWYPQTPSLIQFAIWDAGSSSSQGTSEWSGGPIPWGSNTEFTGIYQYVDVQCYDDNDNPVAYYSGFGNGDGVSGNTPPPSSTPANETTVPPVETTTTVAPETTSIAPSASTTITITTTTTTTTTDGIVNAAGDSGSLITNSPKKPAATQAEGAPSGSLKSHSNAAQITLAAFVGAIAMCFATAWI